MYRCAVERVVLTVFVLGRTDQVDKAGSGEPYADESRDKLG